MSYSFPMMSLGRSGNGYFNKLAASKYDLYSTRHIKIHFVSHDTVWVEKSFTGISINNNNGGIAFRAMKLARVRVALTTRVFKVVDKPDPKVYFKIKRCNQVSFKIPGYHGPTNIGEKIYARRYRYGN